jgi:hypothetical protein
MALMARANREIPLRIVVVEPPVGVVFALQRGQAELTSPMVATGADLSFDLTVRVGPKEDEAPDLLGPYAQGPRGGRFIYLNTGARAAQTDSCWSRRAKISLQGITWTLIEQMIAAPASVLEARITGQAKDGGPACGTVPLLDGWRVVAKP